MSNPLPTPSDRDLAIFELTAIQSRPAREVAGQFGLHESTVRRIVRRVEDYFAQQRETIDRRWLLEKQICQLEYQLTEALEAWRRSQQPQETIQVATSGRRPAQARHTRRTQTGDVRYLALAQRILEEIRRLRGLERWLEEHHDDDPATLDADERAAAFTGILLRAAHRRREEEARPADGGGPRQLRLFDDDLA